MIEKIDIAILEFIQQFQCPFLDFMMNVFSLIGEMAFIWIIFTTIYAVVNKQWKPVIILLVSLLINHTICTVFFKNILKRIRPFKYTSTLISHAWDATNGYSFPSGHSSSSFCAATVLSGICKSNRVFWYILASCVAFSRIYLNVHYPSDVLCGAIFGIMIGKIISYYFNKKAKEVN